MNSFSQKGSHSDIHQFAFFSRYQLRKSIDEINVNIIVLK